LTPTSPVAAAGRGPSLGPAHGSHLAAPAAAAEKPIAAIGFEAGHAPAGISSVSRIYGGSMPDMLCSAAQGASPLTEMVPMYMLMSAFHLARG